MSMVEAQHWAQYRRRHGGLNVAERVEQGAALICATAAQLMGNKKISVADFIPNRESDDELKLATPQDFLKVLQASRKP
jgi:hypothetical protein